MRLQAERYRVQNAREGGLVGLPEMQSVHQPAHTDGTSDRERTDSVVTAKGTSLHRWAVSRW
ncbi:hypothetical protein [Halocatena marina]|uniref:hypothetical protein n=1 Tax=Halocatena marina TaxID=2934937 RepID=UPI00200C12F1|nr:hypothetical protein [Halocatena marina]